MRFGCLRRIGLGDQDNRGLLPRQGDGKPGPGGGDLGSVAGGLLVLVAVLLLLLLLLLN